jgi:hypothetical protein
MPFKYAIPISSIGGQNFFSINGVDQFTEVDVNVGGNPLGAKDDAATYNYYLFFGTEQIADWYQLSSITPEGTFIKATAVGWFLGALDDGSEMAGFAYGQDGNPQYTSVDGLYTVEQFTEVRKELTGINSWNDLTNMRLGEMGYSEYGIAIVCTQVYLEVEYEPAASLITDTGLEVGLDRGLLKC